MAEWKVRQVNGFENLNCCRGPSPVPVYVSVAPTPSTFGESGQGNSVQGSAYCRTSLGPADYFQTVYIMHVHVQTVWFCACAHVGLHKKSHCP